MPVYFNLKNLFTIPRDDESDISENELYLEDPDMLFDRLPQPFRFINKIVNKMCNDSWSRIVDLNEMKEQCLKRRCVDSVSATDKLEQKESIHCMCSIEQGQVIMGMVDGVSVWNLEGEKPTILDQWKLDNMNISSMVSYRFCENVALVGIINEDGSASILAVILGRIYLIKEFPGGKDGDKPVQVTNIVFDPYCGSIALSYTQIGADEHWLEVSKINKEAWIKEIGIVQKAYQEYLFKQLNASVDESMAEESNSTDPSTILDRNAIKVTPTNVILKMKFPDSLCVPGIGNVHQLYKQVDATGSCIGLGLNHCITKSVIDARMKTSISEVNNSSITESHLMRVANVRYLKTSGSLISEIGNEDSSESSMVAVWWSQSQHLLLYGLNKSVQKDPWVKPDGVRTFSCPISVCELSPDDALLSVGLQNGLVILIDIQSGLTRFVKKISIYPINSINFLNYRDSDRHLQYMNVIDDKHAMYCVTYNTSLANNGAEVVSIESDMDVDAVITLNRSYDLSLSVSRNGPLVIRDMFSGTAILKLELAENITISSPWQPIFAFWSNNYLCIQALTKVSTEEDELEPMTLLYKLDLAQFRYEDKVIQQKQDADSKSYITRIADNYLSRRHGAHNERQNQLRECLLNLSQYIPMSSLTVT